MVSSLACHSTHSLSATRMRVSAPPALMRATTWEGVRSGAALEPGTCVWFSFAIFVPLT